MFKSISKNKKCDFIRVMVGQEIKYCVHQPGSWKQAITIARRIISSAYSNLKRVLETDEVCMFLILSLLFLLKNRCPFSCLVWTRQRWSTHQLNLVNHQLFGLLKTLINTLSYHAPFHVSWETSQQHNILHR